MVGFYFPSSAGVFFFDFKNHLAMIFGLGHWISAFFEIRQGVRDRGKDIRRFWGVFSGA